MRHKKIPFKKFVLGTSVLALILQLLYAQLLILLTENAPYGIRIATLTEAFFWPECLAFVEIAAVNVAAFLARET